MMNIQSHLFAATALAVLALFIHLGIRSDTNTKALDTVRYYTMKRVSGDVSGARALVESDDKWLTSSCQAAVNDTSVAATCVAERKTLRDSILNKMGCMAYNSQVCTYLRNLTAGLVQKKTYTGATIYYVGKNLQGMVPGQNSLTYRQILYNALTNVQYLFRNSYKATQADDFYVLRTILYNLIVFPVLGNILVHYFDQSMAWTWSYRLATRIFIYVFFTLVPTLITFIGAGGTALTAFVGIWLPAFLVLVYYEIFLDATIARPWIHPFVFAVMYASMSLLALIESGVTNSLIVCVTIGQAHAVSFIYMQIVWYWTGYHEKKTRTPGPLPEGTHAADIYLTKEVQYALFLGLITITVIPGLQFLAPYDYACEDLTIRLAPLVFLAIAVWGTLYLQDMQLGDHYGNDHEKPPPSDVTGKQLIIYKSTRITGGKLAVSLLLLGFATLYEFNIMGQYFRWLRAYNDKLPERAWQYDLTNRFTIGTGFLPAPTLYL